ncbi:MAG TPA: ferredoxin [Bacilli bacterium]|nr:ferredoxin [Bacilli bacterium]
MKKIILNKTACVGCGACVAICGEHFDIDENGLSSIKKQLEGEPTSELLEAIDSCPTNAISLEETDIPSTEPIPKDLSEDENK